MEDYIRQFVHKFKEEAYTLLSQLEGELLELEADSATQAHLDTIFRVMHTLKGTAGMYGFENVQNLTHHLETIYDQIRSGSYRVSNEVLELTLVAVDHIKNLLEDEQLANPENQERQDRLMTSVLDLVNDPPEPPANNTTERLSADPYTSYYIILRLDQSLFDRGISLVNIFRELSEFGTYAVVRGFENRRRQSEEWGIYFATQHPVSVLSEVFMFLDDYVSWRIIARMNILDKADLSNLLHQAQRNREAKQAVELQKSILDLVEEKYKGQNTLSEIEPTEPLFPPNTETEQATVPVDLLQNDATPTIDSLDHELPEANIAERVERVIEKARNQENARISVSADKLDRLMHLVTELVTTQSQFSLAIEKQDLRALRDIYERTQKLTKQFRDNTLDIRLVPIGDILIRFKRLVRDLARQLGKKIELITEGMETELDKTMIDTLAEPLLHLIRNSIDHGIELPAERVAAGKPEQGSIEITAFHSGSHVFILVKDDGAGLNHERIRQKAVEKGLIAPDRKLTDREVYDLIFLPGFSTAHIISEVSGRGVGMDIVRQRISEIRGEIEVSSTAGQHTTFSIKLQPTIAIIDTMLVRVAQTFCLIPISDIEVCDQIGQLELLASQRLQTLSYNDTPTPYIDLHAKLGLMRPAEQPKFKLVFINLHGRRLALLVDQIIGEHQAVLKPLSEELRSQKLLSSASTLGDGSLAFMLDMNVLMAELEHRNIKQTT